MKNIQNLTWTIRLPGTTKVAPPESPVDDMHSIIFKQRAMKELIFKQIQCMKDKELFNDILMIL